MPQLIEWTPELKESVVSRITAGEPIASIFRDPALPARSTFYLEQSRDESFRTAIAHARRIGAAKQFDDFIELADEADAENYNAIKTRLWARTWVLARLNPAEYGERVEHQHSGELGIKAILVPAIARSTERPMLKPVFDALPAPTDEER